jgi:ubiquinone/menaquinone biosynthesis C-methylase UbiE
MAAPEPLPPTEPRGLLARFLRWFFHHLYTTWAWGYEAVAWLVSFGAWSRWRRTALSAFPAGTRLLEIGCGTGRLLAESLERGDAAVGVDASAQMTRRTAARLRRSGRPIELVRARAQALPFPAAVFPAALSTFPSEYIFEPASLAELRRVLRPDGRMVVVLAAWILPRFIWERLARWLFDATGQAPRPEPRWLSVFEAGGFRARFATVEVSGATVLQLLAAPVEPA